MASSRNGVASYPADLSKRPGDAEVHPFPQSAHYASLAANATLRRPGCRAPAGQFADTFAAASPHRRRAARCRSAGGDGRWRQPGWRRPASPSSPSSSWISDAAAMNLDGGGYDGSARQIVNSPPMGAGKVATRSPLQPRRRFRPALQPAVQLVLDRMKQACSAALRRSSSPAPTGSPIRQRCRRRRPGAAPPGSAQSADSAFTAATLRMIPPARSPSVGR
jgi:hypothetical protein